MKRIFLLLIIAVLCTSMLFGQSSKFTLTGDISNVKAPAEWVYLSYLANGQRITDSVLVKQGGYSFAGKIDGAVQASLRVRYKADGAGHNTMLLNSKRDYAMVFLEPGNIIVASADSFANVMVTGSKADAEYRKFQELAKPFDTRLAELYTKSAMARKNNDATLAKLLAKQIDSINTEANEKIYGDYVKKNPASPLALYALKNWAGYEIDPGRVEPVFKTLPLPVRNTSGGKEMQQKIAIAKKTAIGFMAMDFTQNDTLGRPVNLSSFRGKYLLIDFWASWCGPCRTENPNLVNVFYKYNEKGFQILGISLDKPGAKEKWLKAIHDDGLNWWHVSDLKFWDNAVARQYGIEAIPQNLLLDPSGKIIAKNLRGEALEKKLGEIYSPAN